MSETLSGHDWQDSPASASHRPARRPPRRRGARPRCRSGGWSFDV